MSVIKLKAVMFCNMPLMCVFTKSCTFARWTLWNLIFGLRQIKKVLESNVVYNGQWLVIECNVLSKCFFLTCCSLTISRHLFSSLGSHLWVLWLLVAFVKSLHSSLCWCFKCFFRLLVLRLTDVVPPLDKVKSRAYSLLCCCHHH